MPQVDIEKDLKARRQAAIDAAKRIRSVSETEGRGVTEAEFGEINAFITEAKRCEGLLEDAERARQASKSLEELERYSPPAVVRQVTEEPGAQHSVQVFERGSRAYEKGDALGAIVSARMRFGRYEQPKRDRVGPHDLRRELAAVPRPAAVVVHRRRRVHPGELRRPGVHRAPHGHGAGPQGGRAAALARQRQRDHPEADRRRDRDLDRPGKRQRRAVAADDRQVKLVEKKYMVLVPISNDLRRNSSLETERIVRDDMVTVAGNDEDLAFLRGSGLAGQPKGIYNWVAGREDEPDRHHARQRPHRHPHHAQRLDGNNVPYNRRAWFMPSRSMNYLGWDLVDGNSNFAFPSMQNANARDARRRSGLPRQQHVDHARRRATRPRRTTSRCRSASSRFAGSRNRADRERGLRGRRTLRSGVSRDESAIRLIRKVDFGMRHTGIGGDPRSGQPRRVVRPAGF
jgi:hypothetical protein